MKETIRIVVVDDKSSNRQSIIERVNNIPKLEILFEADNGNSFLNKLRKTPSKELPSIVLMDLDMPIMNGIEAIQLSKKEFPDIKYLVMTIFDDDDKIFEAIIAGANGYLLKEESADVICKSIDEILSYGGAPMSPRIARKALNLLINKNQVKEIPAEPEDEYQLSKREMDILRLLVDGLDYKVVANQLFISPHTVRKHIANIYEKLHVCNKVDAVKIALKKGWFSSFSR